ncbi:hypothetical protein [Nocardia nepalensis]|uniref:hypothetical protein n=1 Tax=Nocardia nepalensis TaxID=3375448 RepID=UPI003B66FBDA
MTDPLDLFDMAGHVEPAEPLTLVDRSHPSISFAHRFDEKSIDTVIERLGSEIGERIADDRPTLCDLILASFALDRDPIALFDRASR